MPQRVTPQSMQSVPRAQPDDEEPVPPSSQKPSMAQLGWPSQVFVHAHPGNKGGGIVGGGGGGGSHGGGGCSGGGSSGGGG